MADRSSADATRFTATQPHAYSQPNPVQSSAASSSSANATPPPPRSTSGLTTSYPPPPDPNSTPSQVYHESPKEKLARLRAARIAQRQIQLTRWERIVIRGRVWADRIHRVTAGSLALFGLVMFGVTGFTLVDMVLYNRKKRAAFLKAQHEVYQARLITAIETERAGLPLEEHQILILARERLLLKAEERKKTLSWWERRKVGFTVDVDKADSIVVPSEREMLRKMGVSESGILEASMGKAKVNTKGEIEGLEETELGKAVKRKRVEMGLEEEKVPTDTLPAAKNQEGGMLDRIGKQSSNDGTVATSQSGGWLPWSK